MKGSSSPFRPTLILPSPHLIQKPLYSCSDRAFGVSASVTSGLVLFFLITDLEFFHPPIKTCKEEKHSIYQIHTIKNLNWESLNFFSTNTYLIHRISFLWHSSQSNMGVIGSLDFEIANITNGWEKVVFEFIRSIKF